MNCNGGDMAASVAESRTLGARGSHEGAGGWAAAVDP